MSRLNSSIAPGSHRGVLFLSRILRRITRKLRTSPWTREGTLSSLGQVIIKMGPVGPSIPGNMTTRGRRSPQKAASQRRHRGHKIIQASRTRMEKLWSPGPVMGRETARACSCSCTMRSAVMPRRRLPATAEALRRQSVLRRIRRQLRPSRPRMPMPRRSPIPSAAERMPRSSRSIAAPAPYRLSRHQIMSLPRIAVGTTSTMSSLRSLTATVGQTLNLSRSRSLM